MAESTSSLSRLATQLNGRARQAQIYLDGVSGRKPRTPVRWEELERQAHRAMSRKATAYIRTGAGAELTIDDNRRGLDEWQLIPRMLRDVSSRDLGVELFGRRLPSPILAGPVGVSQMAHADADVAVAKATASLGVPMVFSNQASRSMEECAAVMGDAPRWFQLYWSMSNELVESFLGRAEASGCEAIVLTLDTTMLGWRSRDLELGSLPFSRGWGLAQYTSDPVFRRLVEEYAAAPKSPDEPQPKPTPAAVRTLIDITRSFPGDFRENLRSPLPRAAVQLFLQIYSRPSITWDELGWLRSKTRLPIVLKGILHPDDARLAVDHGVDGLIISTHGGRQVDGSIGSAQALPDVVAAVNGALPVLLDSGIRSGADVLKAVALGASAVLIGRPWVYGLAVGGEAGVRDVLANLIAELDLTMGLCGLRDLTEARTITLRKR